MFYTEYYLKNNLLKSEFAWIKDNVILETIAGSQMYGCQTPQSDIDFVSIVMPQHIHLYPQQYGFIPGFDKIPNWERMELKGDKYKQIINDKETEGEWVSIINYFYNCMNGSPNLIEVMFARRNLVTKGTNVGWMIRDNRQKFLSMKTFHAFRGYCFQQIKRVKVGYTTKKSDNSKRQWMIDKAGYDFKQSSHVLRLLDQIEQVLTLGDIDLMRNKEEVKTMKSGEWGTFEEFEKYTMDKLKRLEELSMKTKLPIEPPKESLHNLLVECLEEWYGSESNMQKQGTEYVSTRDVFDKLNTIEYFLKKNYNVKDFV